jgi:pyridoxine kinase
MGDQGRLYVNDDVVPAYKKIIHHADLILPNQFEAEVLSGIKITSLSTLAEAITAIHTTYSVPHVIITSVRISQFSSSPEATTDNLTVIGSTIKSDGSPRLFRVDVPALDCFFSGTGDMFAALTVARLREAVFAADSTLRSTKSWVSPDDVQATDLPLAKATVKVLASMHSVLERTLEARDAELRAAASATEEELSSSEEEKQKREYLRRTKAAEVRIVRNARFLREPDVEFQAQEWKKEDLPVGLQ